LYIKELSFVYIYIFILIGKRYCFLLYLCSIKSKFLPNKTMKRSLLFAMIFSGLFSLLGLSAKPTVKYVHPTQWWAGMHNTELQILLYGTELGDLDVELQGATSVDVKSVERFANKNYLIIYVDTKGAPAQTFKIALKRGKKVVKTVQYELAAREKRTVNSFDASDVVYLLMPDRFASATTDQEKVKMYKGLKESTWGQADMARHGGDLKGMTQHLPYLKELGITAIWPTPTLINDMEEQSYHGYAITNYYETDPRYGTNEDYKTFVSESHKIGIKVIKDIVFNHCGAGNFLFVDRPADDWFNYNSKFTQTGYKTGTPGDCNASDIDKKLTIDGWFTSQMPDLNGKNKYVADYLIQASIYWIEYAGIDGIRQDTYPYNDFDFMKRWCNDVEAEYPGFNIVGETWINNNVGVSYWQKGSRLAAPLNSDLKTVMDFPLMYQLTSVVDEETDEWDNGFAKLYALLSQDIVYADPLHLLTFLANHDTDRFQKTEEAAQNITRYKQALTLLLTLRGIPQLYYGDEIGMYANKSVNDGALRQNFPGGWAGDKNNAFTKEGRTALQNEYFDFTKKLLNWRKTNKAVQYGSFKHFSIRNGVYVYSRQYEGKTVTVFANGTSKPQTLQLDTFAEVLPAQSATDVISGKKVQLAGSLELGKRQIYVLEF